LRKTKFFKEKKINSLTEIAMNMQMEIFDKDQTIFNIGDPGNKFYIILKGSVGVHIPQYVKVEPSELERRNLEYSQLKNEVKHMTKSISKLKEKLGVFEEHMKFLMDKLCKTHHAYKECVTKANRQIENFNLNCVMCCASYDGMSQDEILIKKFMKKIKEGKAKYTT